VEYPASRLSMIIEDAKVQVIVTQRSLRDRVPENSAHVLCVEELPNSDENYSSVRAEPDDLQAAAYIIYTSGSTGRPKGIALPHLALTNLVQWHLRTMLPPVRVLQFAPLTFDASFHEIFATLCSGGTLLLASDALRRDVHGLIQFLAEKQIEKAIFPVIVLHELARACCLKEEWLPYLKEITTTGDQLQITAPIVEMARHKNGFLLHNHYGPSETHVVTSFTLSGDPRSWPAAPPIGRPISNTEAFILDSYLDPVPMGVIGELYLAGAGLARGYLNRADLTAEGFIPNPFGTMSGTRMYKTGDLASYEENGVIRFLGRRDRQVKIKGFRIELAEIESVICRHPSIHQAVVVAKGDSAGNKLLVAYVVPVAYPTITGTDIRDFASTELPNYMVPSLVYVVSSLPINVNGKVNYNELLALTQTSENGEDNASCAARNEQEQRMASIWCEVLSLRTVGIQDNFFELGGHSLLATQIIYQVAREFGVELPLRSLFDKPTVAALTEEVKLHLANQKEKYLDQIEPVTALPGKHFLDVDSLSDDEVTHQLNSMLNREK